MISLQHKFIYLHVPKTGGTTIQSLLLPFSDDEKFMAPYQDGIDSFELGGLFTADKHNSLQDYCNILGGDYERFRIIVSARHPVRRILSAIYSPHKWVYQDSGGDWKHKTPYWDKTLLDDILNRPNLRPAVEFLRVDGLVRDPDVVIRCENLESDIKKCLTFLDFPKPNAVPRANRSLASPRMIESLLADSEICTRIEEIYADDMKFFGYSSVCATPY